MTMVALPTSAEVVGDFQAGADADLVEVSGVSLPPGCGEDTILPDLLEVPCDLEVAQVVLGDTETAVDSTNGLSYEGDSGLSAYGHGSNLDVDLLNAGGLEGAIPLDLIQEATAKAPVGPASSDPDPIAIPADPLLHVNLSTVSADALDVGAGNNTCPVQGEDRLNLSNGYSELAGAAVLPDALGPGMDLVGVEDPEGVSYAQSSVDAVDSLVPGSNWGIESTARLRLAPVTLLGGAIDVQVSDPELKVSNDGTGSEVSFTPSIVTINGDTVVDGETIEFLDPLDLDLPDVLTATVDIANVADVVQDGNSYTVTDVVRISVVLAGTLEVVTLSLGDLTALAEVPEGGISFQGCDDNPLRELHKTSSAAEVEPGQEFDYTISVPNRDESCTLTDVTVIDDVTGPDGFEILSASDGGSIDGNTVTWSLDDIAPNETVTLQIRIRAPEDAQDGDEFTDTVSASATCDGEEFENDVMIVMPVVDIPTSVPEGCYVGDSNKTATHEEVKPLQTFNWLINVFNTGDTACTDIVVTDELPDGFTFVDCEPACEESDGVVTFEIDELDRGASVTLAITVAAPNEMGEYENTAVIDPGNGDEEEVSTTHPEVTDESIPLPPMPPSRGDFSPTQMPRTGGGAVLIGLGLLGGLATLRRRTA